MSLNYNWWFNLEMVYIKGVKQMKGGGLTPTQMKRREGWTPPPPHMSTHFANLQVHFFLQNKEKATFSSP